VRAASLRAGRVELEGEAVNDLVALRSYSVAQAARSALTVELVEESEPSAESESFGRCLTLSYYGTLVDLRKLSDLRKRAPAAAQFAYILVIRRFTLLPYRYKDC
jgi:hypothetical protein